MPEDRSQDTIVDEVPAWLHRAAGWSWRGLVVAFAIAAILWLLARLSVVVLPLIIALVLTTLCIPPADFLERRGVPRPLAATIVVVGGLAVFGGLLAALAPNFTAQIAELRPTIEEGVNRVLAQLAEFGYDQERLSELFAQARDALAESSPSIISGVAGGVAALLSALAGTALLLVLLFFFVKDSRDIIDWFIARTPANRREVVTALGRRSWTALSGYVRGTAAIALIDATGVGIGLALIGVPLALPLAILVFFGAFLPVIGAFLTGLIAVLVGLADGGLGMGLAVLLLIVVVQQVEGNVLQPMIMRRAVALHPVVVLTALAIGATVGGIVGAFLSLPVAAVASAIGNELRLRAENGQEADSDDVATAPA